MHLMHAFLLIIGTTSNVSTRCNDNVTVVIGCVVLMQLPFVRNGTSVRRSHTAQHHRSCTTGNKIFTRVSSTVLRSTTEPTKVLLMEAQTNCS